MKRYSCSFLKCSCEQYSVESFIYLTLSRRGFSARIVFASPEKLFLLACKNSFVSEVHIYCKIITTIGISIFVINLTL